jgi:pilus assembly protein CpaF
VTDVLTRVRERIANDAIDELVRAEHTGIADDSVLAALRREVTDELTGVGPLEPLLAVPGVTDVLVNAPDSVWVDRGHGPERTAVRFADDAAVRRLANRLVVAAGRRLDEAAPHADVVLPDGTRLNAVLPPLAEHPTLSLRVLGRHQYRLDDLVALGTCPAEIAELLRAVVTARLAVLVSGGTGAGKTTLLAALLGTVTRDERLVLVEDCRELHVAHPHVVRLAARTANVEGGGAVTLGELVRLALRMRPDRIVVGEFRGAETMELLVALNTGHEGGAATIHANSAADVPARLTALGALAGVAPAAVAALATSGIQVVLHLRRSHAGRMLEEIGLVRGEADRLLVVPAWQAGVGRCAGWTELARLVSSRLAAAE